MPVAGGNHVRARGDVGLFSSSFAASQRWKTGAHLKIQPGHPFAHLQNHDVSPLMMPSQWRYCRRRSLDITATHVHDAQSHCSQKLCTASYPYSPGVRADNILYVSGTLALNSNGNVVGRGKRRSSRFWRRSRLVPETTGSMKETTLN
jgi:enamine deaminase RidA (YjgF/YER057c/UK114 family)